MRVNDRIPNPNLQVTVGVVLISLMLSLWAVPSPAQEDPCLNRTVAVSVTTEDGQLVKGLTEVNFQAKLPGRHGGAIDIASVTYRIGLHRIVVLLDTSGSMMSSPHDPKWPTAMLAVKSLLASATSQTSIAFYTFAARVNDAVDFAQGPKAVVAEVQKLQSPDWLRGKGIGGKTALLDTILMAVRLLQPPHHGDAIFLVTDGGDNASKSRARDVFDALQGSGVRVFVIGLFETPELRGRTPEEEGGPAFLFRLVQSSGGDWWWWRTDQIERDIPARVRLLAQEMAEFYALRIKLPEPIDKSRDWKLVLSRYDTKKKAAIRLIFPHQLAPCTAPAHG